MPPPLPPGYLTPNFSLAELTASQTAVRLGLDNTPGPEALANLRRIAALLEDVRALLGVPMLATSGFRSLPVNAAVGSGPASAHVQGLACDFHAPRYGTAEQVATRIAESALMFDQLIWEGTWVHVALAPFKALPRRDVLRAVFTPGKRTTYLKWSPQ